MDGYTPSYSINSDGTKAVVTNSYSKIVSSSVKVVKEWAGDGVKSPVTVSLWQQRGNEEPVKYGDSVTLNEEGGWEHIWTDLPLSEGQEKTRSHILTQFAKRTYQITTQAVLRQNKKTV